MSRQMRRLQERKGLPAAKDLSKALTALGAIQEIKPCLVDLDAKLKIATEALQKAEVENTELRTEIEKQKQTFLRMFATGMGITLDQVLLMEDTIRKELDANADTSVEKEQQSAATEDQGSNSERGLEATSAQDYSKSRDNQGSET